MAAYIIILIFLLFPLFQFHHRQSEKSNLWYYIAEFLVLVCLMGFRYRVGGDSLRYEVYYLHQLPLNELLNINKNWTTDGFQPLWYLLAAICKSISNEFWVLQLAQAIVVNGIIFYCANKYCRYRYSFILLYYLTQYLYFNCEIMREALAVSFFMMSFQYLISRKYTKYYAYCTIAFLFHASAIILFLFPFIYPIISKLRGVKLYVIIFVIAFIIIFFSKYIILFLWNQIFYGNTYALDRLDSVSASTGLNIFGIISKFIFLLPVILIQYCILHTKRNNFDGENFILSAYIIFGIVGSVFLPLNRLENYFSIFYLMYFTNVVCSKACIRRFQLAIHVSVMLLCISQFVWYNSLVVSRSYSVSNFRKYQRYVPYHSILDKEVDREREETILQHGF